MTLVKPVSVMITVKRFFLMSLRVVGGGGRERDLKTYVTQGVGWWWWWGERFENILID